MKKLAGWAIGVGGLLIISSFVVLIFMPDGLEDRAENAINLGVMFIAFGWGFELGKRARR